MEFYDVVLRRQAIRRYKEGIVDDATWHRIMEAAQRAPSWANRQCWRFVLVRDRDTMMKIGQTKDYRPDKSCYEKAAGIMVICADPIASGSKDGKEYYMLDAGIAMEHVILAATAEGLGTCWIGAFDEESLRELLHIPTQYRIIALAIIGYSDIQPPLRDRLPLEELFHMDKW